MDFNALLNATNAEEIEAAGKLETLPAKVKADPIFTNRLFQVIVKKNGNIIHSYDDVPMAVATRWRREYRNEGFAVDLIETSTTISATKKEIAFTEKNYVPALEGRIPNPVEMSEHRAEQKRIDNHSRLVKKMAQQNKGAKETIYEDIKIFEKISGNLVFKGSADECAEWLKARPDFKISEHVAYIPEKQFAELRRRGF
jgi:hypothetical protein